MNAIGNAMSPYTGQNLGAGRKERVIEGYHSANKLVVLYALVILVVLEGWNEPIIRFFLGDKAPPTALATGTSFLQFVGFFISLIGFKMAVDGVLRGAGDMKLFTLANLTNLALRVVISVTLAPCSASRWYDGRTGRLGSQLGHFLLRVPDGKVGREGEGVKKRGLLHEQQPPF